VTIIKRPVQMPAERERAKIQVSTKVMGKPPVIVTLSS
jgi:hypothetical protein